MWRRSTFHVTPTPPPAIYKADFRQDSTVCKFCALHVFRSEAIRCTGTCNGEFHADCFARQGITCAKCKQENTVTKGDLKKLTSGIDDIKKNLVETDATITGLRMETTAGKVSDNIEIAELKKRMENIQICFEYMEKQMNSLKAVVSTAMTEIKTKVSGLESKVVVLTARQTKFDQIDVSGIENTLNAASHVIVTEMARTLDRLLEESRFSTSEQLQRQWGSKVEPERIPLERKIQMFQKHNSEQQQQQQQNQQLQTTSEGYTKYKELGKSMSKHSFHQDQKTSRLQQLAAQFQLQ